MKMPKRLISFLTVIFFGLVGYFLYRTLSTIEWNEVTDALGKVSYKVLIPAFIASILNYMILSTYDFLGLRFLGIKFLSYPKVLYSAFISYVFNLNLGGLIGGLGLRIRIYSGWGIPKAQAPLIFLFSTLSNWLGYTFLMAIMCLIRSEKIETFLGPPVFVVKIFGCLGFIIVVAYMFMSYKEKVIRFRKRELKLPPLKIAFLQLGLSILQWTLLSGIMTFILSYFSGRVDYGDVLLTYLMASIAGVVAHIPGGLGVLETIFLRMDFELPKAQVLVGLILFRAIYYIMPLLIALPLYLYLEYWQRTSSHHSEV